MKTTNFILLVAVPLFLVSCNTKPRKKTSEIDSMNISGMMDTTKSAIVGSEKDKNYEFMSEAANGSLMEVELGKYAQEHAVNKRVRDFGAMMVRDHSKVAEELREIASKKSINLPTALEDEKHLEKVTDLQKKKGAEFDKEYMDEMVSDHEKDTDKFKRYAENGDDPDLKSFAAKTLPVLLTHQDSAKNIRDALR